MATPKISPLPTAPHRLAYGANQSEFRSAGNSWMDGVYKFGNIELPVVVNWMNNTSVLVTEKAQTVQENTLTTHNYMDMAKNARDGAVGAWEDMQGYTIPTNTAWNVRQMEELASAIIIADTKNVKIITET